MTKSDYERQAVRLVYLCERKGLPTLDAQRATLLAAGLTKAEVGEAYIDRKLKPGEVPQRDYIPTACRSGDEVWVSRPAVIATTEAAALDFAAMIARHGAVLCIASTGDRFSVPPEAREGVDAGLRLVALIKADERAAVMERARRGKGGKTGGRKPIERARLVKAEAIWRDHLISGDDAAERTGISKRTLARYFGKRGTPAFGKALNTMREKAEKPAPTESVVYLLVSFNGPVKIGASTEPEKRVGPCGRVGFGACRLVWKSEPTGLAYRIEARVHRVLKQHLVKDEEWFSVTERKAISTIKRATADVQAEDAEDEATGKAFARAIEEKRRGK